MQKLVESLAGSLDKLETLRREFEVLVGEYYVDNVVHADYLLTRAQSR